MPLLRKVEFYDAGTDPGYFVMADFDQDGHKDLMVTNGLGPNKLTFLHSTAPSPSLFGTPQGVFSSVAIPRVGAGDINGDGLPDLATNQINALGMWVGTPQGPRHARDFPLPGPNLLNIFSQVLVGDLNQDGYPDVVAGTQPDLSIYLNVTPKTFLLGPPSFESVGPNGHGLMVLADATGDGILDITLTSGAEIWVLKGAGDGTFATHLVAIHHSRGPHRRPLRRSAEW